MIINNYREFLSNTKEYAVFGASRSKKGMGFMILENLVRSGFQAVGINPSALESSSIYSSLEACPQIPNAAIISVSMKNAPTALEECAKYGIKEIWMQPGTIRKSGLAALRGHGSQFLTGRCIFLYLNPRGFPHNLHRKLLTLFRKY